jgi:CheY-like chemotaxis protein
MNLLLVHPTESVGRNYKDLLESFGYTVMLTDSGHAALGLYRMNSFDLVMTALRLDQPTMASGELAEWIRKIDAGLRRTQQIPIVLLTRDLGNLKKRFVEIQLVLLEPLQVAHLDQISQLLERVPRNTLSE